MLFSTNAGYGVFVQSTGAIIATRSWRSQTHWMAFSWIIMMPVAITRSLERVCMLK
jgi:hypothetical protein